jgi:LPS-assembly protein
LFRLAVLAAYGLGSAVPPAPALAGTAPPEASGSPAPARPDPGTGTAQPAPVGDAQRAAAAQQKIAQDSAEPGGQGIGNLLQDSGKPLEVRADDLVQQQGGFAQLRGAVKLLQGQQTFEAEQMDFDQRTGVVTVKTRSVFRDPSLVISSDHARFDLRQQSGSFFGTDYELPTMSAHGFSQQITINADGTAHLTDTTYTTCPPGDEDWSLRAREISLDHDEGLGTARAASLRVGDVPVLYMPYFQFPIDDRRRSGLLYPTIGQSSKVGFETRWPVYLNLAPNYDATVTPRYMSERGLQLGSTGRYLFEQSEGRASLEYLPHDEVTGDARSLFSLQHLGLINQRLGGEISFANASDPDYFRDLGSSIDTSAVTHLEQRASLDYQSPGAYHVQAMVQRFQPITNDIDYVDKPYKRLPEIRLDALTKNAFLDTRAGFNGEFVNFARDDSVEGRRVDMQPYLQYLHDEMGWYVGGQADMHYTRYQLTGTADGEPEDPDRALPVVSAEAGMRFQRYHDDQLQLLEPRLFALYVPYENQDDLPLFDTGEPDFGFVQLFARNRFSGVDRISDARQVAGALTMRSLDPATGLARWSASLGQLYRFQAPKVNIEGDPAPLEGATQLIGQADYHLSRRWSASAAGQWQPKTDSFERGSVGLRYVEPDSGLLLDAAYRYREDLLEQTEVAASIPVTHSLRVTARHRYSLKDTVSLDTLFGLEYSSCCWTVRTAYRRYILDNSDEFNSGIYLQFELKGLSSIGTGVASLMPDDNVDDAGPYRRY